MVFRVRIRNFRLKEPLPGRKGIRIVQENGEGWSEALFQRSGNLSWSRTYWLDARHD
jgi:hypothetical protein